MSRGGKKLARRQERAAKKTGSHRNSGSGFSVAPIANREESAKADRRPVPHKLVAPAYPHCQGCSGRMRFEQHARRKTWFWVCNRCKTALPYKPLKTGLAMA